MLIIFLIFKYIYLILFHNRGNKIFYCAAQLRVVNHKVNRGGVAL